MRLTYTPEAIVFVPASTVPTPGAGAGAAIEGLETDVAVESVSLAEGQVQTDLWDLWDLVIAPRDSLHLLYVSVVSLAIKKVCHRSSFILGISAFYSEPLYCVRA